MKRLLRFAVLFLYLFSCSNNEKQQENEKNIIGDWVFVDGKEVTGGTVTESTINELSTAAISFYTNHECEEKSGYVKRDTLGKLRYYKTKVKFKITADSLKIGYEGGPGWSSLKIAKLDENILQVEGNGWQFIYKHFKSPKNPPPQFDKIILSASGCMVGGCPMADVLIDTSGLVLFNGMEFTEPKGLFKGRISKKLYHQLQDNFRKADFDSLKNEYTDGSSDEMTISTTFVKNGKIYKSVSDHGIQAPPAFRQAYDQLEYLYQSIPSQKTENDRLGQYSDIIDESKLFKGDSVLRFKLSESFLLLDYLRNGKISTNKFKPLFQYRTYYSYNKLHEIATDGRFFIFIPRGKTKPVTIDIGFNFIDINFKNAKWDKKWKNE